jgi:hypothetical protein
VLIEGDVKDDGPASYEILRDSFDLPETLNAISHSGGVHHVFALPDDVPDGYLKNWNRITDAMRLPGIDIKTGVGGLMIVEPTRGAKGVYRWVDPTAEIAVLPRALCDKLHELGTKRDQQRQKAPRPKTAEPIGTVTPSPGLEAILAEQPRWFKDVAPHNGQH